MKRSRRGNEKRWNQLGEPFAHMLGGVFFKTKDWINRKITQAKNIIDSQVVFFYITKKGKT
jgi:hypothetical protein